MVTDARSKQSGVRGSLLSIAREPLFWFIVTGLLTWGSIEWWRADNDRYTIRVGTAERQRIAGVFARQFGAVPTPQQLQYLVDRYIREEIFLREGLALGLDVGDEIVRRRVIQKYEFLQSDLAVLPRPDQGELQRWFERNKQRYLTPERVTFNHVYFSADRGGEEAAKLRALKVLRRLRAGSASPAAAFGDAFPGPTDTVALTPEDAKSFFGQSELSSQLFKLPMGQWLGPYRSGYGWHLLSIMQYEPSRLPSLMHIQGKVFSDFLEEQRKIASADEFEKLRSKYTVRSDEGS